MINALLSALINGCSFAVYTRLKNHVYKRQKSSGRSTPFLHGGARKFFLSALIGADKMALINADKMALINADKMTIINNTSTPKKLRINGKRVAVDQHC